MRKTYKIDFDTDFKFFAILPAFNINRHGTLTIEFEWLFWGLYITKEQQETGWQEPFQT